LLAGRNGLHRRESLNQGVSVADHRQNSAQTSAQTYFRKAEQSDELIKKTRRKEQAASAAKTANLRQLRLAKEAADKEEAEKLEAGRPAVRKREPRSKPAPMLRLRY